MSEAGGPIAPLTAPRPRRRLRRVGSGAFLAALLLLVGCRSTYYGQAIRGQWSILAHRQPVAKVLASPQTPPALAAQLKLALRLRDFAEQELHLPANGHFLSYVDVHRAHVIWNVYAAPEFALKAKTWWYPLVGSLEYRGYFAEADAHHYAERLARRGWDTYVGAVDAYSTLGWFREPLINTFINYREADLAGILFHELAHQKVFAHGDSDFDEAFAVVVEEEGVRRWFKHTGQPAALERYERSLALLEELRQVISRGEAKLNALYGSATARQAQAGKATPAALAELRQQKQALLTQLRDEMGRLLEHKTIKRSRLTRPPNNATLSSEDTYYRLAPTLRRLLAQQHGDLTAFYAAAQHLARLSKAHRQRQLERL